MTKYLVICGILSKNNCVVFCNAFPKTELSPPVNKSTCCDNKLSLTNEGEAVQLYQIATLVILVALDTMATPRAACVINLVSPVMLGSLMATPCVTTLNGQ